MENIEHERMARVESKVDSLAEVVGNLDKTLRNGLVSKVAVIESRQNSQQWWHRTIFILVASNLVGLVALFLKVFGK